MNRLVWILLLLLVPPTSASLVELDSAVHSPDTHLVGDLRGLVLRDRSSTLLVEAGLQAAVATVYWSTADVHTGDPVPFSSFARSGSTVFHNATFTFLPREQEAYLGVHGHDAMLEASCASTSTTAPTRDTFVDVEWMETQHPQTTNLDGASEHRPDGACTLHVAGDADLNVWGWIIRVQSDEGTWSLNTGYNRTAGTGSFYEGTATQAQVVAATSTLDVDGAFGQEQVMWLDAAVIESAHLILEDVDGTTELAGQLRFEVLNVGDDVLADITDTTLPPTPVVAEEPDEVLDVDPVVPAAAAAAPATSWTWWAAAAVGALVVYLVVRFAVGWPTPGLRDLIDVALDQDRPWRAAALASLGHALRPQEPVFRYLRGITRSRRDKWHLAFRDLEWATRRLPEKHRGVASWAAAKAAAHLGRGAVAARLLLFAHKRDPRMLVEAEQDPSFSLVMDDPAFREQIRAGLGLEL